MPVGTSDAVALTTTVGEGVLVAVTVGEGVLVALAVEVAVFVELVPFASNDFNGDMIFVVVSIITSN